MYLLRSLILNLIFADGIKLDTLFDSNFVCTSETMPSIFTFQSRPAKSVVGGFAHVRLSNFPDRLVDYILNSPESIGRLYK